MLPDCSALECVVVPIPKTLVILDVFELIPLDYDGLLRTSAPGRPQTSKPYERPAAKRQTGYPLVQADP